LKPTKTRFTFILLDFAPETNFIFIGDSNEILARYPVEDCLKGQDEVRFESALTNSVESNESTLNLA